MRGIVSLINQPKTPTIIDLKTRNTQCNHGAAKYSNDCSLAYQGSELSIDVPRGFVAGRTYISNSSYGQSAIAVE